MTRSRATTLVAALACAALTSTVACTVTVESDSEESREITEEVLAGDELVIDLADPPSRADLGVPDGRKTFILERDGFEPFDVTVRFSDQKVLRTPAVNVGVTTNGTDDPTELAISRSDMSLDELEAALLAAVTELGAEQGRVDSFLELAPSTTEGEADLRRSIPTAVEPPESLSLRPIVTALEGRVSIVHYLSLGQESGG